MSDRISTKKRKRRTNKRSCPKRHSPSCHDENGLSYKAMNELSGESTWICRRWLNAIELDGVKLGDIVFFDDAVHTAVALIHKLSGPEAASVSARLKFHEVRQ